MDLIYVYTYGNIRFSIPVFPFITNPSAPFFPLPGSGLVPVQQVLRGLPGAEVLRRHRGHRRDREALPEEGARGVQVNTGETGPRSSGTPASVRHVEIFCVIVDQSKELYLKFCLRVRQLFVTSLLNSVSFFRKDFHFLVIYILI